MIEASRCSQIMHNTHTCISIYLSIYIYIYTHTYTRTYMYAVCACHVTESDACMWRIFEMGTVCRMLGQNASILTDGPLGHCLLAFVVRTRNATKSLRER